MDLITNLLAGVVHFVGWLVRRSFTEGAAGPRPTGAAAPSPFQRATGAGRASLRTRAA